MVGVPRSTGCQLCVKRRVRCDEARPACGNCVKYGADCPGYERGLKFVTGKHVVRPRRRKGATAEDAPGGGNSTGRSPSDSEVLPIRYRPGFPPPSTLRAKEAIAAAAAGWLQDDGWEPTLLVDPSENRALFIATLAENVRSVAGDDEVSVFDTWLRGAPAHLGSRVTMDSAMCCMVTHLLGKAKGDDALVAASRSLYGRSLAALQRALAHPVEWKADETLAAAMVMCGFELFSGTSNAGSWMHHCRGIAKIIEQRGPDAHRDGLGATLLLSFRSIIIMNDMFGPDDKGCFLATKRWKPVARDRGRQLFQPAAIPTRWLPVLDDYFEMLAELPQILKWAWLVRNARRAGLPVPPERVRELEARGRELRARYVAWFAIFEALQLVTPREVASRDPASIYPTVLWYDNKWTGCVYVGYWASLIIVQEALNQCRSAGVGGSEGEGEAEGEGEGQDKGEATARAEAAMVDEQQQHKEGPLYAAANQLCVRNILRSIESLAQGLMGPFRVGFAIRVAYEFADVTAQNWIKMWLDRFEKTYAATTKKTYPVTQANEYGYR